MSDTPLRDALKRIGTEDGFDLGVLKEQGGDPTVTAQGAKRLGKGWSVGGAWEWAKDTGHAVMGKLSWRPKG